MKVLIVDDNALFADALTAYLRSAGHEAEFVGDGLSALTRLDAPGLPAPDVIVLDLCLPAMSGETFLERRATNAKWEAIPVIVTTALPTADLRQCEATWPKVFGLPKPFEPADLVRLIEKVGVKPCPQE